MTECDEQSPGPVSITKTPQSNYEKYKGCCQRKYICRVQQTRLSHVKTCQKQVGRHRVNYSGFTLNTRCVKYLNSPVAQSHVSLSLRSVCGHAAESCREWTVASGFNFNIVSRKSGFRLLSEVTNVVKQDLSLAIFCFRPITCKGPVRVYWAMTRNKLGQQ